MSAIRTTSDGYSFHTMELKTYPDGESYNKSLELLYGAARKSNDSNRTIYPITRYGNDGVKSLCSTMLRHHGILLYFTETIKSGGHYYTVKAVVNPRRVLEPKCGYLGIAPTDRESLELFQNKFTGLMRLYRLPEFLDEWTLTRLDLCVNLQLNKKKSAREICRLLKKDLLPSKLERVHFFDQNAGKEFQKRQKDMDRRSICLANNSYAIVVYDKLYQAKVEGLDKNTFERELPDSILRLEVRCFKLYLDKLMDHEALDAASDQLYWLAQNSRELILKKVTHAFSGGMHYKPDIAKRIISESSYQEETRRQLIWLVDRVRYSFNLQQLEKGMKKEFGLKPRTVADRLEQLERLEINLVPLRKDFYLDQLPSLITILEALDDEYSSFSLASDGSIEF